ncbi:aminomethyl-transferring glycine dehydrogenase subunit GcvPA [Desulfogranum marinum]|uniref:aminomethyl-transferring glycine dehydrogenase subunit GcvPA n=1 Tax=Desulfogranum marinum TaxID=453220 RepID=UPI0019646E8F|nr:aminomethyl-transferring glycine dehydrogenase subunit GcvPA [Desulfogranum marinum]MBM9511976.1 aminomethyl-transferring glycine dehydrogenase subunit GcvPA [Desulfogranum marinum]
MRYLPHTQEDITAMLQVTGNKSLEDLFSGIPDSCRMTNEWQLPEPKTEWELNDHMQAIAQTMKVDQNFKVLIGAGSNHHHIPETVKALMSRSEFLTAYTPYQPEMAQGTLQGIFEYQTLTARLLGMDVVNASMYDGASAFAEALLMGLRIGKKKTKVAVSAAIHPHYRATAAAYLHPTEFELIELPYLEDGRTDLSGLSGLQDVAAVALQSPNFFGVIEDLAGAAQAIHEQQALFITCFSEPLAYGLLKNPGKCGADIVCGEGQSFGLARSFGGPGLGMFGCRQPFTRNLPGRLVGETKDLDGKRGYVLTLATREQHIRREKATSNICSNQGICAMTAGMYMASLGGTGLRELSRLNYDKAQYLKNALIARGARLFFEAPIFNEFVVEFPHDFQPAHQRLLEQGIVAGLELSKLYPELKGRYLFGITETTSRQDMDRVADEVQS